MAPEHLEQAVHAAADVAELGVGGVLVSTTGRVITAEVPVSELECAPERWLTLRGSPECGAWRLGQDRWAVYGGEAARLEARKDGDDSRDVGPGTARFDSIRRRAGELLGCGDPSIVESPGSADPGREPVAPRLYGGFSFHQGHRETSGWTGFPAGRFVLPAWELRTEDGRVRLLVHQLREDLTNGPPPFAGLKERLGHIAGRVLAPADETRPAGGWEEVEPEAASAPDSPTRDPGSTRIREATEDGSGPAEDEQTRQEWLDAVRRALRAIESGEMEKVVLARPLTVQRPVDPLTVFSSLRRQNPASGLFFIQPTPGAAFLGASPELLASVRGRLFRATAVAGSIDRGGEPEEDDERARMLLGSTKDRREQAIVTDDIRERLTPVAESVEAEGPRVLRLARIQHLESRIEARLPRESHVLDLVARIHPTPAVCGRPWTTATVFLLEAENFQRGWYAGPVGWFDSRGDGAFIPGLRSALYSQGRWQLFAGAGIVPGSVPKAEWEETGLKFRAMLRALGLPDAG